jgi:hypothetical protein
MQPHNEMIRQIGRVLRQHLGLTPTPSPELQALLLRLAVREAERAHYGGHRQDAAA